MQEATRSLLTSWQNFYVIIGSSAAALTGLMFVVITLIAGNREARSGDGIAAFGTPNVVHFCSALLVAATLSAPWQVLWNVSFPLGFCGLGGMIYIIIVIRRARRQTDYQPVLEDRLWHSALPFVSYTALVVAAVVFPSNPIPVLFIVGAATILLLFIGIHNAWDTVTYVTIERIHLEEESQDK